MIVDSIDLGLVGAMQVAVELEIVGRIGEDDVDGFFGQPVERGDTVPLEDRVQPFRLWGNGRNIVEKLLSRHSGTRKTRYYSLSVMVTVSRKYLMKRGSKFADRGVMV